VAGLVRGHYYPEILSARARVQGLASWDIVIFILNNLSFVLIGLQLHGTFELFRKYPCADPGRCRQKDAPLDALIPSQSCSARQRLFYSTKARGQFTTYPQLVLS
jgi:hypothetical protein